MTLDSFLDAVIPWIVAIVGVYLLYRPLKEPIDSLGRGIKNILGWGKRKITGEDEDYTPIPGEWQNLEYE